MLVPNRHGQSDSYRYGFQGQEKDDEIKGEGNSLNYTYRMYDPRVGHFFAVDPLAQKFPNQSPYNFCLNNLLRFVDSDGRAPDDIVFRGRDKKEIRVKTAGEDKIVNLPFDIGKDRTVDIGIGNIDPNRFVYGYTAQADIGGSVGLGAQWGGEVSVANFTDNKYSGYNYVYAGGHVNKTVGAQVSISASVGGSVFVGYNDSKDVLNPSTFSGNSYTYNASMDLKAIVGGGISVGAFSSVKNPISEKGWKGFSLGINVGVGGGGNAGAIGRQDSYTFLLNNIKPTSDRGIMDRASNALAPLPSAVLQATYNKLNP